jgi:acetyl-CoA carboxylase carboxyl transferase subunit beta
MPPIWRATVTSARSAVTTMRLNARARIDLLLDAEGRFEIGAEVLPVDSLLSRTAALSGASAGCASSTGETEALVVMQGTIERRCR